MARPGSKRQGFGISATDGRRRAARLSVDQWQPGAWCLFRRDNGVAHFEMFTLWDDFCAIRRFAGEDINKAKYYDFDPDFLLELEEEVVHFRSHRGLTGLKLITVNCGRGTAPL
jgi:hypothetical protein